MTLQEYKNQIEPQRMPDVVLQPKEYKIITTLDKGTQNELSLILIEGFPAEYVKKVNSNRLYTTDTDGNPKAVSCFRIA